MKKKSKSVLLLTASHLSSCPRLIKKAISLENEGYKIKVLFLCSLDYVNTIDENIISKHSNWHFYKIDWNSKNILDIILRNISKILYKLFSIFNIRTDFIHSTTYLLIKEAKGIKADFYIAHQPSVLVAAAKSAKKYNAKLSYDVEDAFAFVDDGRFENNPDSKIVYIENKYLPKVDLLTYASPAYLDLYKKLYKINCKTFRLLNVFDLTEKETTSVYYDRKDLSRVSLYWVSQTIGMNRGLQDVLMALTKLDPNSYELHLRGVCTETTKNNLLSYVDSEVVLNNIYFHELVQDSTLEIINSEHDIGLSLEMSNCLNRELCLSNKIFEYLRANLAIISTNTKGNRFLLGEMKPYDFSYNSGDVEQLALLIKQLIDDKILLISAKNKSQELAKTKYNWSIESKEWIKYIDKTIN